MTYDCEPIFKLLRTKNIVFKEEHVIKLVNDHLKNKKWIVNKFLGGTLRLFLPSEPTFDNLPEVNEFVSYLESIVPEIERQDLKYLRKKGNPIKMTKIIKENWGEIIKDPDISIFKDFEEYREATQTAYARRAAISVEDLKQFLIYYGDKIATARTLVLSVDPFDFFTISENAAYSSCLRVGGEYDNTISSYLNTPQVLLTYIVQNKRPDYKIGRSVIYVDDDMVLQSRTYGSFYSSDTTTLRHFLQEKLGGLWIKKGRRIESDLVTKEAGNPAYIDYNYGIVSMKKKEYEEEPTINIAYGVCINCGETLTENNLGQAMSCNDCLEGRKCSYCERIVEGDLIHIDDQAYCETCYDDLYDECLTCGEAFRKDDMHRIYQNVIFGGHDYLCEDCFKEAIVHYCVICNRGYSEELKNNLCARCAEKKKEKKMISFDDVLSWNVASVGLTGAERGERGEPIRWNILSDRSIFLEPIPVLHEGEENV